MLETDLKTVVDYRKAVAETEAHKKMIADLDEALVKYQRIENDKVSEGDFLNKQAVAEAAEAVIRLRMIPAKRAKVESRLAACIEAEAVAQQALGKELYELVIQIGDELPAVYTRALKPFFGSEDLGFVVQGVLNTAALPGMVKDFRRDASEIYGYSNKSRLGERNDFLLTGLSAALTQIK